MMKSGYVLVLLLVIGVASQAAIVPGGDFGLYKPDGTYSDKAVSVSADIWVQGMGLSKALSGGTLTWADATTAGTGDLVDCSYGWAEIAGERPGDPFSWGINTTDGTSCFNAFAGWGGGNGNLMESAAPLTRPVLGAGESYEISAMVNAPGGPRTLDLLVGGVVVTPTSQVDPPFVGNNGGEPDPLAWAKMSKTYASIPDGDVTIQIGIPAGQEAFGSRIQFDDVSFSAVPEPATMLLLGLGGLGLIRRKRS